MREAGVSLVRIGEFAWSRIEPEEARFDWDWRQGPPCPPRCRPGS
ncbi:MAG: beta-galactosidase [Pseudomonadota bacterium]